MQSSYSFRLYLFIRLIALLRNEVGLMVYNYSYTVRLSVRFVTSNFRNLYLFLSVDATIRRRWFSGMLKIKTFQKIKVCDEGQQILEV